LGGIGLTLGNQIIRHFFVDGSELRPLSMSLLDDTVDLDQQKSILFMQSFGLGTTPLLMELFGTAYW